MEQERKYKTIAVVKRVLFENPHFRSMDQKKQIRIAVEKIQPDCSDETVYRELRKLREEGLFDVDYDKIEAEKRVQQMKKIYGGG